MSAHQGYRGKDYSDVDDMWPESTKVKKLELKTVTVYYVSGESVIYSRQTDEIIHEINTALKSGYKYTRPVDLRSEDSVKRLTIIVDGITHIEEIWS